MRQSIPMRRDRYTFSDYLTRSRVSISNSYGWKHRRPLIFDSDNRRNEEKNLSIKQMFFMIFQMLSVMRWWSRSQEQRRDILLGCGTPIHVRCSSWFIESSTDKLKKLIQSTRRSDWWPWATLKSSDTVLERWSSARQFPFIRDSISSRWSIENG